MPRIPAGVIPAEQVRIATPGQLKFLTDLYNEREHTLGPIPDPLPFDKARDGIEWLKKCPYKARPLRIEATEEHTGIWTWDGHTYKVLPSVSTGNMYAQILDVDNTWTYIAGAVRNVVTHGQRMTLEQAKEFGRLTGQCIKCGRTLTNPASIEAGIGPICAGSF